MKILLLNLLILKACEWLIDGRKIAEIDTIGFHFVHKIINTLSAAKAKVS